MKWTFAVAALLCAVPALAAPAKVKVLEIIDGDTFVIEGEWAVVSGKKVLFKIPGTVKVRVLGIDTPEKGHLAKCPEEDAHSKKAVEFATSAIKGSDWLATIDGIQHDKYGGRIDADPVITMQGVKLSYVTAMIAGGYAKPYTGEGEKPNWCAILKGQPQ